MSWIWFALIGYLFYALVTVANKVLLGQRATTKPIVFTFFLGVLSIFTFVLAPFGLQWPGISAFAVDIFVGVIYFFAIWTFYEALDINEASRVSPLISGLTTLCVPIFAYFLLSERLTTTQIAAFCLLIVGGFLMSIKYSGGGMKKNLNGLKFIIATILLGAVYWIGAKYIFDSQGFITGYIWSRFGFVAATLGVLVVPSARKSIFSSVPRLTGGLRGVLLGSKLIAGLGSLFIHLALARGSASLTNAMAGVEFAIVLILTVMLSKKYPQFLEEKLGVRVMFQKIVAILLISLGLVLIAI